MNVADPTKVKEAGKRTARERRDELDDVQAILSMPAGRRFYWRLLDQAGIFRSIWEPSAKIHYNAGQQDFGHFLMSEAVEAGPELYLQMQREAQQRRLEENTDV